MCHEYVSADYPLALVRLSRVAPLIIFRDEAYEILEGSEIFVRLEETRASLMREHDIFPLLHYSHEDLPFLLERDIDSDYSNLSSLNFSEEGTGGAYRRMLQYLQEIESERRHQITLLKLATTRDRDIIRGLLESEPYLLDPQSVSDLRERGIRQPEALPMFEADARFLEDLQAGNAPNYDKRLVDWDKALATLHVALDELDERGANAFQSGDWVTSIDLARTGVHLAANQGMPDRAADFARKCAAAVLASSESEVSKTEQVIELLRRAVESDPTNPQVSDFITLGAMYGSRRIGDRARNLESAIEFTHVALTFLDPEKDRQSWGRAHGNLSLAFSERIEGRSEENLRLAFEHAQVALKTLSVDEHPCEWGFAQINLGVAAMNLARVNGRPSPWTSRPFVIVLTRSAEIHDDEVIGMAALNLARARMRQPFGGSSNLEQRCRRTERLLSLALDGLGSKSTWKAQIQEEYARLAGFRGDGASITSHLDAALHSVTADESPFDFARIASRVGNELAEKSMWTESAEAFEQALGAMKRVNFDQMSIAGREDAAKAISNLNRWASFAIARAGNSERAAEVLEGGRARALGDRASGGEIDLSYIREVDPILGKQLSDELELAMSSDNDDDWENHTSEVNRIRAELATRPGLQWVRERSAASDLEDAVSRDWPLMFINPTPEGTLLLLVTKSAYSKLDYQSRFIETTSSQLINMLMFATSNAPEDIDDGDLSLDGPSYWVAVTAVGDSPEGIEFGLQYVGSKFMKHVDNWVAEFTDNAIAGLSILASGPLAMMPLQAAAWTTNEGKSYLVDRIPIRYAPSCHLLAMCRRRETLHARIEPSLFGIADPSDSSPLPSSREELVAIAGMFPTDRITTAFGKDATSYFLRQCGGASHLHLACHATADTTNYRDSAFLLADGWFDLHQILRIGGLNSLVAVASACQTGTIDLDGLADEAYSLAGALIAAGSASAVASCWPVDDYATALLLIKFYECLLSATKPPAASALQTAQIWLRELDGAAEKAFIQEYPALRNAKRRFDRRNLLTKRIPRMFGRSRRVFASEEYWGSFIVVGA